MTKEDYETDLNERYYRKLTKEILNLEREIVLKALLLKLLGTHGKLRIFRYIMAYMEKKWSGTTPESGSGS